MQIVRSRTRAPIGHATSLMFALALAELTYMLCGNYAAGSECVRELARFGRRKR